MENGSLNLIPPASSYFCNLEPCRAVTLQKNNLPLVVVLAPYSTRRNQNILYCPGLSLCLFQLLIFDKTAILHSHCFIPVLTQFLNSPNYPHINCSAMLLVLSAQCMTPTSITNCFSQLCNSVRFLDIVCNIDLISSLSAEGKKYI